MEIVQAMIPFNNGYQSNGKRRWPSLIAACTMAKMTWAWSSSLWTGARDSGGVLMGFVFRRLTFASDVYNPPLIATLAQRIFMAPGLRVLRCCSCGYRPESGISPRLRTLRKRMDESQPRDARINWFPNSKLFSLLFLLFQPNQWVAYPPFRERTKGERRGSGDSQWELSFITGPRGHNETKLRYNEGPDLLYIYIYIHVVVGFAPEEHVFPSSSRPKGIITLRRGGERKGWGGKTVATRVKGIDNGPIISGRRRVSRHAPNSVEKNGRWTRFRKGLCVKLNFCCVIFNRGLVRGKTNSFRWCEKVTFLYIFEKDSNIRRYKTINEACEWVTTNQDILAKMLIAMWMSKEERIRDRYQIVNWTFIENNSRGEKL